MPRIAQFNEDLMNKLESERGREVKIHQDELPESLRPRPGEVFLYAVGSSAPVQQRKVAPTAKLSISVIGGLGLGIRSTRSTHPETTAWWLIRSPREPSKLLCIGPV